MQSHSLSKSDAERVAEYVVLQCSQRHNTSWLGSRAPEFCISESSISNSNTAWLSARAVPLNERLEERLSGVADFSSLIANFQLKGVREDSRQGLLGWLEGRYPLTLLSHPPTPEELLNYQCRGERVVTLFADDQGPIGRHAGPYEFLLHDLEHAHKFFGEGSFLGQKRFFNLLREALHSGAFAELSANAKFSADLDYLMADMNSHPLHLLKYLKAIVLEAMPEKRVSELDRWCDNLFNIWDLPEPVREAARKINYPALENNEARLRVSDFFAYT